jgi:hypothetical protein
MKEKKDEKKIEAGQYWIDRDGSVIVVKEKGSEEAIWLVNRIRTGGSIICGVGVTEGTDFIEQLPKKEAEKTAMRFAKRLVDELLDF